jgi:hypothetical protein
MFESSKRERQMRPARPQRLDLHNVNVDFAAALRGLCGFTHLATGRVCELPNRHDGPCEFGRPISTRGLTAARISATRPPPVDAS